MNPNIARKRKEKAAHLHSGNGEHQHQHEHQSNGAQQHKKINVGEMERQVSMVGGTVLAVCGLLKGSISGLALAGIGAALIWRGHTGHCEVYHMLGHSSADEQEQGEHARVEGSRS
jgi:uncharacterized membrane protein